MVVTKSREGVRTASIAPPPLAGKIAIVTGASSGIGEATAWELARRGAQVVLAARRGDKLNVNAAAIIDAGGQAVAISTDVSDAEQVAHLVTRTEELFGRVDILVNNAGIAWKDPYTRNSVEQLKQSIDVNLTGAILLTRVVLPGMLQRRHGAIISVASVAAHIAVDPLYCATKYGLRGFSLSLRRQLAGTGISVSLVSPGFIRTPLNRHMRMPMPGPRIVATAIADLAVRPRREVVVPRYYSAFIFAEHLFPWAADFFIRLGRRGIIPRSYR
jgi:NAD(P)-dependent dehydrogenase (short-subunit alcohol dehydrogenase family)